MKQEAAVQLMAILQVQAAVMILVWFSLHRHKEKTGRPQQRRRGRTLNGWCLD